MLKFNTRKLISSIFNRNQSRNQSRSVIRFFGQTDPGLKRVTNEDVFLINHELKLYLIADGMGGEAAGEIASHIFAEAAVEIFSKGFTQSNQDKNVVKLVQNVFSVANERILQHIKQNPLHRGMGCTAELLSFSEKGFVVGHIGDSRTYCFRDNKLKQLSTDHSFVQEQIDKGVITSDQSRGHPMRHVILRAVGIEKKIFPDIIEGNSYPGDVFLLCSDGLTDMVDDQKILETLLLPIDLSNKIKNLMNMAISAGGSDNITVILGQTKEDLNSENTVVRTLDE
ncbi:MAG: Stp1/IreP family PP2C-type Ser/Thr phosphatase [Deltaproteobacteria bacterium]|nr:Stp1/IreP family PP2C-type Ser/Thr phosphatase [Deltaproteobacteria bacterium]